MYYIQENDKPNWLNNKFNILKLENNKIILPIDINKINNKKEQKLAEKTKKILDKTHSKKIIVSKETKQLTNYINCLHSYNFEIVDSKWLFEVLSVKALDFIVEKRNMKKEETKVGILVNDLTQITLENIRKIAKEYKSVGIVTNHMERLKKLEEQILEDEGIIINITNNKRKSLNKVDLILNIDFPSELINKYNINDDAIIINIKGKVKINKKRFKGININDYEIKFENHDNLGRDILSKYKMAEIYEAKLYKKTPYKSIMDILKKDNVEILMLQGKNMRYILAISKN